MANVRVCVDESSMAFSKNKLVTGIVFFDFEKYQFPQKEWNDFVVVILTWWLDALKNIVAKGYKAEEFRFMDGPMCIEVTVLSGDRCKIACIDERNDDGPEFSGTYSLAEIFDSVISTARAVCDICRARNWESDDIDDLNQVIRALSRVQS